MIAAFCAAMAAAAAAATIAPTAVLRPRGWSGVPAPARVGALVALAAAGVLILPARSLLLVSFAAIAGVAIVRLVGGRGRAAQADRRAEQVLLACESIAGDLSAGVPPGRALDRVVEHWPEFGAVAVAARLDADVPDAFRELAALPGAGQLRVVGAAWQVAHRSGSALGPTIAKVADLLREEAAVRRLVGVELAAARVTARMTCALPVLVLFLAVGVGADPWHFLTSTPVGLGCLLTGGALDLAGLVWMQRIADAVSRR